MTTWRGETCRSCGEPVLWAVTEAGKNMPIDRDPVPGGNTQIRYELGRLRSHAVTPDENVPAYVSHFVSCPQRQGWRKK